METEIPAVETAPGGPAGAAGAAGGPGANREEPPGPIAALARGPLAALAGLMERPLASYYLLLASSGLLLVIGLVMVFSATSVQAYATSGNAYSSVTRQAIYALIGLAAFWFAHRLPVRTYRGVSGSLMIFALGMLAVQEGLVFLTDIHALGAPRLGPLHVDNLWLYLGPIQLQPSEFGKLALALWGAGVMARLGPAEKRLRDFARALLPGVVLMLLLVGYSDVGTMMCLAILVIGLLYAGGVRMRVFGSLIGAALVAVMLLVLVQPYRVVRLTGFLHSPATCDVQRTEDPCYQALEARYAIADGGWFGVGLGQGHLKWGRLPNGHNDFIFAIIAEELGVFGCVVVLALLAVLAYTGLRIARRVTDPYRRIAATGITAWLVGQATINIGGVIGLLPITGLPLPFISDGGSALVVVLAAVGVLASFARAEPDAARALHARPPDRWVRLLWAPLPPLPRAERAEGDAPARPAEPRAARPTPPRTRGAAASSGLPRGSGSSGRGGSGRSGTDRGAEPGRNGTGRAGTDRRQQPGRGGSGGGGARGRTERRG